MEEMPNQNAGSADSGVPAATDPGAGGGNSEQPSNPAGQGGNPTGSGQDDLAKYKAEVRRLNAALVEAKRGSRQQANQAGDGEDPYATPQGQYAAAIKIATGEVRGKLEDVIPLYPELDPKVAAQIRKNPWAFASQQSFVTADVDTAMLEIEQYVADLVDSTAGAGNGQAQPAAPASPTPASVNANPAPTPASQDAGEDQVDPWTQPMEELEKDALKAIRMKTAKK